MPEVIAIGNVNVDITIRVSRLPGPDEKLLADEHYVCLGGAATNFAIACARLGLSCGLIACVGQDPPGKLALEALRAEGVDVSHVRAVADAPTGLALILWAGGRRGLVSCRGANDVLASLGLDEGYLSEAKMVLAASVSPELARKLAAACDRLAVPFVLDPGGPLSAERLDRLQDVLARTHVFTPNRVELTKMTGESDIVKAIESAREAGPDLVVVKAGPDGCFVFDGSSLAHVRALEPPGGLVDPTGAGDAFNAGLVLGLLRGLRPMDAARLGVALATLKLARRGASNMPSLEELRSFLAALGWHELLARLKG